MMGRRTPAERAKRQGLDFQHHGVSADQTALIDRRITEMGHGSGRTGIGGFFDKVKDAVNPKGWQDSINGFLGGIKPPTVNTSVGVDQTVILLVLGGLAALWAILRARK